MKELSYLNKYFVTYKWHFILGFLFVALSNYFRVLQPQAIRQALDLVFENIRLYRLYEGFDAQQTVFKDLGTSLAYFALLVILLALMMGIFMYFMRQTIIVMSRLIEYDMRKEIFGKYEALDLSFYKKNMTGDLMARITEDVSKVRMYLGPAVLYGINLFTLFVMVIYSMFSVSVELSLYCLLPLPLLSVSIYFVSSVIHQKSEAIQIQLAKLNSFAQEVFNGIRVVKSYGHEAQMSGFFGEQCEDYKDKSMKLAKVNALFFPLMLLIIGASTILTIYFGGLQVFKGNVTPGNIAEFVIYVNMLTWPVTSIGWIASIIQQAEASQKRINEFLKAEPKILDSGGPVAPIKGHISFRKASFTYKDTGIQALKNINFNLLKGQKLAVLGKTGSGKSTLADLLLRMYDVDSGSILIDGRDIREMNLANLRNRIGYVPQDVFLFSDTISQNISFGKEHGSIEKEQYYAKKAAVYEDIMTLPDKFETFVGERGVTLSGGQKQRVSIARTFIREPDIVILDDCLSAVDTRTENQILTYLNDALSEKTTIVITHRLYGMLQFDKIIVLDKGEIIEEGTHDELIEKGGFYTKMHERQRLTEMENKTF